MGALLLRFSVRRPVLGSAEHFLRNLVSTGTLLSAHQTTDRNACRRQNSQIPGLRLQRPRPQRLFSGAISDDDLLPPPLGGWVGSPGSSTTPPARTGSSASLAAGAEEGASESSSDGSPPPRLAAFTDSFLGGHVPFGDLGVSQAMVERLQTDTDSLVLHTKLPLMCLSLRFPQIIGDANCRGSQATCQHA